MNICELTISDQQSFIIHDLSLRGEGNASVLKLINGCELTYR